MQSRVMKRAWHPATCSCTYPVHRRCKSLSVTVGPELRVLWAWLGHCRAVRKLHADWGSVACQSVESVPRRGPVVEGVPLHPANPEEQPLSHKGQAAPSHFNLAYRMSEGMWECRQKMVENLLEKMRNPELAAADTSYTNPHTQPTLNWVLTAYSSS